MPNTATPRELSEADKLRNLRNKQAEERRARRDKNNAALREAEAKKAAEPKKENAITSILKQAKDIALDTAKDFLIEKSTEFADDSTAKAALVNAAGGVLKATSAAARGVEAAAGDLYNSDVLREDAMTPGVVTEAANALVNLKTPTQQAEELAFKKATERTDLDITGNIASNTGDIFSGIAGIFSGDEKAIDKMKSGWSALKETVSKEDYESLKGEAVDLVTNLKAYAANPSFTAGQIAGEAGEEIPQIALALATRSPGALRTATVMGSSNDAMQVSEQVYQENIKQGKTKEEAFDIAKVAGLTSLAANQMFDVAGKAPESIAAGKGARGTKTIPGESPNTNKAFVTANKATEILKTAALVPVSGAFSEGLDQAIQNIATGQNVSKGIGAASAAGFIMDPAIGAATAAGATSISAAKTGASTVASSVDKGIAAVEVYNSVMNQQKTLGPGASIGGTKEQVSMQDIAKAGKDAASGTVQKSDSSPIPAPVITAPATRTEADVDSALSTYNIDEHLDAIVDADYNSLSSTEQEALDSIANEKVKYLIASEADLYKEIGLEPEADQGVGVIAAYTGLPENAILDKGGLTPEARTALIKTSKKDGTFKDSFRTPAVTKLGADSRKAVASLRDPDAIVPSSLKGLKGRESLASDASIIASKAANALGYDRNSGNTVKQFLLDNPDATVADALRTSSSGTTASKDSIQKALTNLGTKQELVVEALTNPDKMNTLFNAVRADMSKEAFVEALGILGAIRNASEGSHTARRELTREVAAYLGGTPSVPVQSDTRRSRATPRTLPSSRDEGRPTAPKKEAEEAEEAQAVEDIKKASAKVTRKEAIKVAVASLAHGTTTSRHLAKSIKAGNIRLSNFKEASVAAKKGFGTTNAFILNNTIYINTANAQDAEGLFSAIDHEMDHLFRTDDGLSKIDTLYSHSEAKEAMIAAILASATKAVTLIRDGKSSELTVDQLIALKAFQQVHATPEGAAALAKLSGSDRMNPAVWTNSVNDIPLGSELAAYFVEYRRAAYSSGLTKNFLSSVKAKDPKTGKIVDLVEVVGDATLKVLSSNAAKPEGDLSRITNGLLRTRLATLSKSKLNKEVKAIIQRSRDDADEYFEGFEQATEDTAEAAYEASKEEASRQITDVGNKLRAISYIVENSNNSTLKNTLRRITDIFPITEYSAVYEDLSPSQKKFITDFIKGFELLVKSGGDAVVNENAKSDEEIARVAQNKRIRKLLDISDKESLAPLVKAINITNTDELFGGEASPFGNLANNITIDSLVTIADQLYQAKLGFSKGIAPRFMETVFSPEELDLLLSMDSAWQRLDKVKGERLGKGSVRVGTVPIVEAIADKYPKGVKGLTERASYVHKVAKKAVDELVIDFANNPKIVRFLETARTNPERFSSKEVISLYNTYEASLKDKSPENLFIAFLAAIKASKNTSEGRTLLLNALKSTTKGTKLLDIKNLALAVILEDVNLREQSSGDLAGNMATSLDTLVNDPGFIHNIDEGKLKYGMYPGMLDKEALLWSPTVGGDVAPVALPIPLVDNLSTDVDTPFSKTSVVGINRTQEETGLWPAATKAYGYVPHYGSSEHFGTDNYQVTQVSLNNPALWSAYNPDAILKSVQAQAEQALSTTVPGLWSSIKEQLLINNEYIATAEDIKSIYGVSTKVSEELVKEYPTKEALKEIALAAVRLMAEDVRTEVHTYNRISVKETTKGGGKKPVANPGKPSAFRKIYPSAAKLGLAWRGKNSLSQNAKTLISIGGLLNIVHAEGFSSDSKLSKLNVLGFTKKSAADNTYTEMNAAGAQVLLTNATPLTTGGFAIKGLATLPVYNIETQEQEAPLYVNTIPSFVDAKNYLKFVTDDAVGYLHVAYTSALVESITDTIKVEGSSLPEGTEVTDIDSDVIDITEESSSDIQEASDTPTIGTVGAVASLLSTESGQPSIFLPADPGGKIRIEHPASYAMADVSSMSDKDINNYSKGKSTKGFGSTIVNGAAITKSTLTKVEGPVNKTKRQRLQAEVLEYLKAMDMKKLAATQYKLEVGVFMEEMQIKYGYPDLDSTYKDARVSKSNKRKIPTSTSTLSSVKKEVTTYLETSFVPTANTRPEEIYSLTVANSPDQLPLSLINEILNDAGSSPQDVARATKALTSAYLEAPADDLTYFPELIIESDEETGKLRYEVMNAKLSDSPLKNLPHRIRVMLNSVNYRKVEEFVPISYENATKQVAEYYPELSAIFSVDLDGETTLSNADFTDTDNTFTFKFNNAQPNNTILTKIAGLKSVSAYLGTPEGLVLDMTALYNPSLWRTNREFKNWQSDQAYHPIFTHLPNARGGEAGSVLSSLILDSNMPFPAPNSLTKQLANEIPELFYLSSIGASSAATSTKVINGFTFNPDSDYKENNLLDQEHVESGTVALEAIGATPIGIDVLNYAEYMYPFGTARSFSIPTIKQARDAQEAMLSTVTSMANNNSLLFNDQEEAAAYAYSKRLNNRGVIVAVANKDSMAARRNAADAEYEALDDKFKAEAEGFDNPSTKRKNSVYAVVDLTEVFDKAVPGVNDANVMPNLFQPFSISSTSFITKHDSFNGPALTSYQNIKDSIKTTPGANRVARAVTAALADGTDIGEVFRKAGVSSYPVLQAVQQGAEYVDVENFRIIKESVISTTKERQAAYIPADVRIRRSRNVIGSLPFDKNETLRSIMSSLTGQSNPEVEARLAAAERFITSQVRTITQRQRTLTRTLAANGLIEAHQLNDIYSDIRLIDTRLSKAGTVNRLSFMIGRILSSKYGITDTAAINAIVQDYLDMRKVVEDTAAHVLAMVESSTGLSNNVTAVNTVKMKLASTLRTALLNERVLHNTRAKLSPRLSGVLTSLLNAASLANPSTPAEQMAARSVQAAMRAIEVQLVRDPSDMDASKYRADPMEYIRTSAVKYFRSQELDTTSLFGKALGYSDTVQDSKDKIEARLLLGGNVAPEFSMILAVDSMRDLLTAAAVYQGLSDRTSPSLDRRFEYSLGNSGSLAKLLFRDAKLSYSEQATVDKILKKEFAASKDAFHHIISFIGTLRTLRVAFNFMLQIAAVISSLSSVAGSGSLSKLKQASTDALEYYTGKDTTGSNRFVRFGSKASAILSSADSTKDVLDSLREQDRAEVLRLLTDSKDLKTILKNISDVMRRSASTLRYSTIPVLLGAIESVGRHAVILQQVQDIKEEASEYGEAITQDDAEYRAITIGNKIYPTPTNFTKGSVLEVASLFTADFLGFFIAVTTAAWHLAYKQVRDMVVRKHLPSKIKAAANALILASTFTLIPTMVGKHVLNPYLESAANVINSHTLEEIKTIDNLHAMMDKEASARIAMTSVDPSGFRYVDTGNVLNVHTFNMAGWQALQGTVKYLGTQDENQFRRDLDQSWDTLTSTFVGPSWIKLLSKTNKYDVIDAVQAMVPRMTSTASLAGGDSEASTFDKVMSVGVGTYSHSMAYGSLAAVSEHSTVFPETYTNDQIKAAVNKIIWMDPDLDKKERAEFARKIAYDLQEAERVIVMRIKGMEDAYNASGNTNKTLETALLAIQNGDGPVSKVTFKFITKATKEDLTKFYAENPGVGLPGGIVNKFGIYKQLEGMSDPNNEMSAFPNAKVGGFSVPWTDYLTSPQGAGAAEVASRVDTYSSKSNTGILNYLSDKSLSSLRKGASFKKVPLDPGQLSLELTVPSSDLLKLSRNWKAEWSKKDSTGYPIWKYTKNMIKVVNNGKVYYIGMQDADTIGVMEVSRSDINRYGDTAYIRITNADASEATTDKGYNRALQAGTNKLFDFAQDSPTVTIDVLYDVNWAISGAKRTKGRLMAKVATHAPTKRQLARVTFTTEDGSVYDLGTMINDQDLNYVNQSTGRSQRLQRSQQAVMDYAEKWVYEGLDSKIPISDHDALEIAIEVLKKRPELGITVKASGESSPVYKRMNRVYINSDKFTTRRNLIKELLLTTGGSAR